MLGYLLWSGRLLAYWRTFLSGAGSSADAVLTAGLWLGAVAPLIVTACVLGNRHTAARRLGFSFLVGLREVVGRARSPRPTDRQRRVSFAHTPRDNARAALAWGMLVAIFVPLFFGGLGGPDLRTPLALVWLGGTGVLMGGMMYCRRRASAYIQQEPSSWDIFRAWRLLNPSRYEEQGRLFVRCQIGLLAVLPFWWLGGAAVVMSTAA
jgi:hypothetical protein